MSIEKLKAELEQARKEIRELEADKIAAESCVQELMESLLDGIHTS